MHALANAELHFPFRRGLGSAVNVLLVSNATYQSATMGLVQSQLSRSSRIWLAFTYTLTIALP